MEQLSSFKQIVSPNDVQRKREQVLDHFEHLHELAKARRRELEDAKTFLQFVHNADELETWIKEKLAYLDSEEARDQSNLQGRQSRLTTLDDDLKLRAGRMDCTVSDGMAMVDKDHIQTRIIVDKIDTLKDLWSCLLSRIDQHRTQLMDDLQREKYFLDADDLIKRVIYIKSQLKLREPITDSSQLAVQTSRTEDVQKDISNLRETFIRLRDLADELIVRGTSEAESILRKKLIMAQEWEDLLTVFEENQKRLELAKETLDCMSVLEEMDPVVKEKLAEASSSDLGQSLEEVLQLQQKNRELSRDFVKLNRKMEDVFPSITRLCNSSEESSLLLSKIHHRLCTMLDELHTQIQHRTKLLENAERLHGFYILHSEAIGSLFNIKDQLDGERLAVDVVGAESLIKRLNQYQWQLDESQPKVEAATSSGKLLVTQHHSASQDVLIKVSQLEQELVLLHQQLRDQNWMARQCLEAQIFFRDSFQVSSGLSHTEAMLLSETPFDETDNSTTILEEKVENVLSHGTSLVNDRNYASLEITEQINLLMNQRDRVFGLASRKFKESQTSSQLSDFQRSNRELRAWMVLKLPFLTDNSYQNSKDITWCLHKHQALMNDIGARGQKLHDLHSLGQELVASNPTIAEEVASELLASDKLWEDLNSRAQQKASKLASLSTLQAAKDEFDDLIHWVERKQKEVDVLKNPSSPVEVIKHQDRLEVIESSVESCQPRVEAALQAVLPENPSLSDKANLLSGTFTALRVSLQHTRKLLDQEKAYLDWSQKVQEQLTSLEEKNILVLSTTTGNNVVSADGLRKRHQLVMEEIQASDNVIQQLLVSGNQMITEGFSHSKEIKLKMNQVEESLRMVKMKGSLRTQDLEDSLHLFQYLSDLGDARLWLKEKEPQVMSQDYGVDEDTARTLLKRHMMLLSELDAFRPVVHDLHCSSTATEATTDYIQQFGWSFVQATVDHLPNQAFELPVRVGDVLILVDASNPDWCKVENCSKQGFVPAHVLRPIDDIPSTRAQFMANRENWESIGSKQEDLENMYQDLLNVAEDRRKKLEATIQSHNVLKEANNIEGWIKVQENTTLESVPLDESFQLEDLKALDENMEKNMAENECKIRQLEELCDTMKQSGHGDVHKIQLVIEDLTERWTRMKDQMKERQNTLKHATDVQQLKREVDETTDWIADQEASIPWQDYGDDLNTLQSQQKKLQNLERDLTSVESKIHVLNSDGDRLLADGPDTIVSNLSVPLQRMNSGWSGLIAKVDQRRVNLDASFQLYKFMSDSREFLSWIEGITTLVVTQEDFTDVYHVEAALDRHMDVLTEIENKACRLNELNLFGQRLLDENHFASKEIMDRLQLVSNQHAGLLSLWETKKRHLDNSLKLQLFLRDSDLLSVWLQRRILDLKEPRTPEQQLKVVEGTEKACLSKEGRLKELNDRANSLVSGNHPDSGHIEGKLSDVINKWNDLRDLISAENGRLDDLRSFQQFLRDTEEIKNWFDDKFEALGGDQSMDLVDALRLMQQHEALESEISANDPRIRSTLASGTNLLKSAVEPDKAELVKQKQKVVSEQWELLLDLAKKRHSALSRLRTEHQLLGSLTDFEHWLSETESSLADASPGHDLVSTQQQLKRLGLIHVEISNRQDRLRNIEKDIESVCLSKPHDTTSVLKVRMEEISKRYTNVTLTCGVSLDKLRASALIHQLVRMLDVEEAWIKEKRMCCYSSQFGNDMATAQYLLKKHQALVKDLTSHAQAFEVLARSSSPVLSDPTRGHELTDRVNHVRHQYQEVKVLAQERLELLKSSLAYLEIESDLNEEIAWISEKVEIMQGTNLGDSLAAAQSLIKQHQLFEGEFQSRKKRIPLIEEELQALQLKDDQLIKNVTAMMEDVKAGFSHLGKLNKNRYTRLMDQHALLQFNWMVDMVGSWIDEKERLVRSPGLAPDLATVHIQMARLSNYESNLKVFENDSISRITALKNELTRSDHSQMQAVQSRYDAVMVRWSKLNADVLSVRKKLQECEAYHKQIEDLFLLFAKKASVFNNWFENSEEELTDLAACFSLEEVKSLVESHELFKATLQKAQTDYNELVQLDQDIRKYGMTSNPFTWFTIEALHDTWLSLKALIQERDVELEKESLRQNVNENLRRAFADQANRYYQDLSSTRDGLVSLEGDLNDQATRCKTLLTGLQYARKQLAGLENLNNQLQLSMVFDNKYTPHSLLSLAQQADQLQQLGQRVAHNLEQQIAARRTTGVSEDKLREFAVMFNHFDVNQTGVLEYQEFKSCLRSLGYDLPVVDEGKREPEFENILSIVDPNGDGVISLNEYMAFLISQETDNVHSLREVEEAFMAITADQSKPFVLEADLVQALPQPLLNYCKSKMSPYYDKRGQLVQGAYDFRRFCRETFIN